MKRKDIINIIKELFYVLTGALVIFFLMEVIKPNIVIAYINYNIILIIWLIVGIFVLVKDK